MKVSTSSPERGGTGRNVASTTKPYSVILSLHNMTLTAATRVRNHGPPSTQSNSGKDWHCDDATRSNGSEGSHTTQGLEESIKAIQNVPLMVALSDRAGTIRCRRSGVWTTAVTVLSIIGMPKMNHHRHLMAHVFHL